ncbi:hypothetical protein HG530_008551 [Fusarium avenaceum]|nr:hypothetical protein HG530_008551 [Fusarium avenaceum]
MLTIAPPAARFSGVWPMVDTAQLKICNSKLKSLENTRLLRDLNSIIEDSRSSKLSHILCHVSHSTTGRRVWVVGQDKVRSDGEETTTSTLEDEEPLPTCKTHRAIETGKDTGGDEA